VQRFKQSHVIASGSAAISGSYTPPLRDCFVPRNDEVTTYFS
jgi:hypothetical protein